MRIGVMLRALGEKQGVRVYSRNLMDELLPLDKKNEYTLFYNDERFLGTYSGHNHVEECVVHAPNKLLWDQVQVPIVARKRNIDVIFHTKFTVPLLTSSKTVMTIHGSSWFMYPDLYGWLDARYIRTVMPFYCRKATAIFSNSRLTADDFVRILKVPREKIFTTKLGTSADFRIISDQKSLAETRVRYDLPEKFILAVIKYHPLKNFENLIAAFRILKKRLNCKLVVVGRGCEKYADEYSLAEDGTIKDVRFIGWIDHEDLPGIYNLAHCLLFPSIYEEFGLPACEALACGCPLVVSKTGNLPEIAGDAGILVDPRDPQEISDALEKIWTDTDLRAELSRKCLARAPEYTWRHCAGETLAGLNTLG